MLVSVSAQIISINPVMDRTFQGIAKIALDIF